MKINRQKFVSFLVLIFVTSFSLSTRAYSKLETVSETEFIGGLVFKNECNKQNSCLIAWNEGENFLSLGIGHFIWYPADQRGPFNEIFPKLLLFLEARGVEFPVWFKSLPGGHAPWAKRDDFITTLRKGDLEFLRNFLIQTKKYQAEFIVDRFRQSIPIILQATPKELRAETSQKLSFMIHSVNGLYPLADYVNFKGEGVFPSERYKGKGWGLLQVLHEMKMPQDKNRAVLEFVIAAEVVLKRRVDNSPPERNEKRWLLGWQNRIRTYLTVQSYNEALSDRLPRETLLPAIAEDVPMTEGTDVP